MQEDRMPRPDIAKDPLNLLLSGTGRAIRYELAPFDLLSETEQIISLALPQLQLQYDRCDASGGSREAAARRFFEECYGKKFRDRIFTTPVYREMLDLEAGLQGLVSGPDTIDFSAL